MYSAKSSPPYLLLFLIVLLSGAVGLFFFWSTFSSEISFDEGGKLRVIDIDGDSIPGLIVTLDGKPSTTTDEDGRAFFPGEGFPRLAGPGSLSVSDQEGNEWFVLAPWGGHGVRLVGSDESPVAVTAVRFGDADLLESESFLFFMARHLTDSFGGPQPGLGLQRTAEWLGFAEEDLERALSRRAETAASPLERAVAALALQRPDEAVRLLTEEPQAEGADLMARAWYLGLSYSHLARWIDAANAFQTALDKGMSYSLVRSPLALSHLQAGNHAAASPHVEAELREHRQQWGEYHPWTLQWELFFTDTLIGVGEPGQAETQLRRLRDLAEKLEYADPTFKVGVLNRLELALESQGKSAEAAEVRREVSGYVAELDRLQSSQP